MPIKFVHRQTQADQIVDRQTQDNQIVDRQTNDNQIVYRQPKLGLNLVQWPARSGKFWSKQSKLIKLTFTESIQSKIT